MKSKKHKVEIPEGYKVANMITDAYTDLDGNKHYVTVRLSLSPIKKQLPKTWEEYVGDSKNRHRHINYTKAPSQYTESFEALGKLIELRDHYNDGWEPDYNNYRQHKYTINVCNTIIQLSVCELTSHVLAFKTEELRDRFHQYFRELIETAKPLL